MTHASIAAEKSSVRERLLAARAATGDPQGAAAAVCRRVLRLPELASARTVAGYAATAAEVSVDATLQALIADGLRVCLPWVAGRDLHLGLVTDLSSQLVPGYRGVREPARQDRQPLRPAAVDVFIVPGVGFDRAGNRLGYGGGHFDRLLARASRAATVVGVCLDEQLLTALPADEHDVPVDVVVTPTQTVRPGV